MWPTWLRDSGTLHMELLPLPPTVNVEGLATLLCCSPGTVKANASRSPEKVPPPIRTGGRRLIWLTADVMDWLAARRSGPAPAAPVAPLLAPAVPSADRVPVAPPGGGATPKRGRPTKVEQLARRREGGAR